MMESALFVFVLLLWVHGVSSQAQPEAEDPLSTEDKLKLVASWKSIDYTFPTDAVRQQLIESGEFSLTQTFPLDMDVVKIQGGLKIFVTLPRARPNVPATLTYFTSQDGTSPRLTPFPNWEANRQGNCDGITSVFRTQIDRCGRMWVLDTGRVGALRICPAQLLIFNPITDELLYRYRFPQNQLTNTTNLITPIVDVRGSDDTCSDTFVYMTDVRGYQLLVYDHANQRSWNIINNLFYPYPPFGTANIDGTSFDLMDGIFTGSLGPLENGDRRLYFHSFASNVESYVSTAVIRNYETFKNNPRAAAREFKPYQGTRRSQAAVEATNENGVMLFGMIPETAIGCWNSRDFPDYDERNIETLVVNKKTLQFASGLKIIPTQSGRDELWVLTNRFQKISTNSLDLNEVNFRIQMAHVDELVRGTTCEAKLGPVSSPPTSSLPNDPQENSGISDCVE